MWSLGAAVTGTVDDTYDENDVCDGDPSIPIRVASGTVSLALTFAAGGRVNGLIVANHNLPSGESVDFSGLGTVTMPTVPPGDIRLNGLELITPTTVSSTTVSLSGPSPTIIGEVIAGLFREVRTLPPRADFAHRPIQILNSGEYGGLSYSKGAVVRTLGGSILLNDEMHAILQDAFDASRQNSLPTAIAPFCSGINDVLLVTWQTYNPHPLQIDGSSEAAWSVDVVWQELPRYRWPA